MFTLTERNRRIAQNYYLVKIRQVINLSGTV